MLMGIEIGGTKLQVGVRPPDATQLTELLHTPVRPSLGARGILEDIARLGLELTKRHAITAVGIGFGGPVSMQSGHVIKSHHVSGWDDYPLSTWARQTFGKPAAVANDCDVAGLAEAQLGAGKGTRSLLYVTVGTGIGGGLILDGKIHSGFGLGAAELGHLRPGLQAESPEQIVEAWSAGWGIAEQTRSRLGEPTTHRLGDIRRNRPPRNQEDVRQRLIEAEERQEHDAADLLERCDGELSSLTTKMISQAASDGNAIAIDVLDEATRCLGWALAQAITLLAPEVVVIGGGVSEAGEELFWRPLRSQVTKYVFPAFARYVNMVPAALGSEVVVQGAICLAQDSLKPDAPA